MKKMKKMMACTLSAMLLAGVATGCGPTKSDEDTLTITVSNLGFGTEWLDKLEVEFERIYDVEVKIEPTVITDKLLTQLEAGYQMDDLCLFAGVSAAWDTMRLGCFTQIDDVWASTPEGDSQTIAQKATAMGFDDSYKMVDGHYYSMPFIIETGGLAYNKTTLDTLFGAGEWELPKTTQELIAFSAEIKSKDAYAFTWCTAENAYYWDLIESVWAAQYNGIEKANYMPQGKIYDDSTSSWVIDTEAKMLEYLGRQRAYEVESILLLKDDGTASSGYSHQYCTSMEFIESQSAFAGMGYANDKKLVAFTPNGNWLYEETKDVIEYNMQNVGFMQAPVLSSIVENFTNYSTATNGTDFDDLSAADKAKYDSVLVAIIDYVNAGKTGEKPTTVSGFAVTDADITYVESAMGITLLKDQAHAFIPINSKNPTLAKKFLTFFASDYAGQLYSSVTHGFNPFHVELDADNENFYNDFDKDVYNVLTKTQNKLKPYSKHGFYISRPTPESIFFTPNKQLYGTPDKAYGRYKEMNTSNGGWTNKLRQAGLLFNGDT